MRMKKKYITKAPKRSKSEILRDRERITDLLLMGYNHRQIMDVINDEGGHNLSISAIRNDIKMISESWRQSALDNYDEFMNRELARIDTTEKVVWDAWRKSCSDAEREVVERVAKEIGEDDPQHIEMVVERIVTTTDKSNGVGDPRLLDKIIQLQRERIKLLGLYAPTKLGIDINKKSEVVVKGYAVRDVSPDVWPALQEEVVDGEFEEQKKLTDGK